MRSHRRTWALAFAVGSAFALASSFFPVNDGDLFWHLATARWVAAHGELARTDVFSSTAFGAPVPQHEWLSELLLYAAWSAGSWWGIVVVRVAAVLALSTVVTFLALEAAPRPSIAVAAAVPGIALSRVDWNDRVELYGLVCFAAFLLAALAARRGRVRALIALPPLFVLWANLHGSFALGSALLVALSAEVVLFAPRLRRAFLIATIASALAVMVHPDGPLVYANPLWHFLEPPRFIEEWRALDVLTAAGAIFTALVVATAATAALARTTTAWAALLVPLAVLGFGATRYVPFFALAASPYLATYAPRALEQTGLRVRALPVAPPALASAAIGVALLTAAVAAAAREPDLRLYPVRVAPFVTPDRTLFNEYLWGGYLIWTTQRPVFVDGRLRPYAGRVIDDYLRVITLRPGWQEVLDRRGVGLVVVRADQPLVGALRSAGWRPVVDDADAAVLQRP